MSFLSLEKYLYGPPKPGASGVALPGDKGYSQFSQDLLGSIDRSVLAAPTFDDLAQELNSLRNQLCSETPAELLVESAGRFDDLMRTFRERLKRAEQERAEDFRKVLAILNEAFGHLAAGSERSDICFKRLEESLQAAAKLNDLRALKSHLFEVLKFVRQQSEQEGQQTQGTLQNLGEQIRQAHESASQFGSSMPGRDQAIAALAESMRTGARADIRGRKLYTALFVADALGALRVRHGSQVSDGLIEDLSRKDILRILPGGRVYRWGPNAVMAMWHSEEELAWVSNHIANACKNPFDHRAFVGARVATFSIPMRSMTLGVRGDLHEIVPDLDRFEAGR